MIIPIGAQNAYVINQGISREHHMTTASICFLCDIILISSGIFGGGALLASYPVLLNTITLAGIAFLSMYAWQFIQSARQPAENDVYTPTMSRGRRAVIIGALAVTLLNPHVYLDTVVVLGAIGGQFAFDERVAFTVGALLGSCLWFYGLSAGAARLSPWLSTPSIRRLLDTLMASMMLFVAIKLALGLYTRLVAG
ncbi:MULTISPECIES: LysE/ArgO family amino acid transporter [Salinivibrio]|uniref:LysE/ArgO family amino acid transporter n=1 Tax=Salinivibrio TaxID=51366 RepID=UPI00098666EB|nr:MULTISPECIES: LysE/ArgO family amino acid transporter [Salinivibrio]OOF10688.1 amino acid transporter [Salinivibrio sp. PR5]OOF14175.1 amino acid transporter [Salinivibrio sp. PR919]OOF19064.1 amino acid transporter [Salinivibrio sp. PR932]OOF29933.1 amino acid transporter [Salinivibrio proteolyticus]